jgi:hypothetical protein
VSTRIICNKEWGREEDERKERSRGRGRKKKRKQTWDGKQV